MTTDDADPTPITALPADCLREIATRLHASDRLAFAATCRTFRDLDAERKAEDDDDQMDSPTSTDLTALALDPETPHLSVGWYEFAFRSGENPLGGRLAFTALAASQGNVEALRWLRLKGCPWDERASLLAARGGHVRALALLRQKGCPFTKEALECLHRDRHGDDSAAAVAPTLQRTCSAATASLERAFSRNFGSAREVCL